MRLVRNFGRRLIMGNKFESILQIISIPILHIFEKKYIKCLKVKFKERETKRSSIQINFKVTKETYHEPV